jgi:heptosyltransferase II
VTDRIRGRILVIGPSWVGDMVMAQPLIARLQAGSPDAVVDVFAPGWVLPIVRRMPGVAAAIDSPFAHGELALGRRWRTARTLNSRGYRQAVVLPNSIKSALVPWFAGIPRRTGFLGEQRRGLLNDIRRFDPATVPRLVDRFLLLGDGPIVAPMPHLECAGDATEALLTSLGLALDKPVACLCPGAEYGPAKRWPVRHFAALARRLAGHGFAVWLLGSAKDAPVADAIRDASGGACTSLAGRTDLGNAADLLACAAVVVSNDSGLMHVAAAVGSPVVALFGSSSPDYTPPLSGVARIVRHPVPCSPCFQRECPLGHFACMENLSVESVLAESLAAAGNSS